MILSSGTFPAENRSTHAPYSLMVRDVGIASSREPEGRRGESTGTINMTFRGTSDARSSVDRDTRVRIAVPSAQAARLWQLLGTQLTEEEKQQAEATQDR